MITILSIVIVAIVAFLIFKSWAKTLPAKRTEKEIQKLELELGDLTVEGLKKDLQESLYERKIRRLKALYQEKG